MVAKEDVGDVFLCAMHHGRISKQCALIDETGARAVKFRLGGRMSRNADSLPGRSETLIRLAREKLGEEITLYADANSSYDVPEAVRIGRLMEDHGYGFLEEPCEFDDL